MILINENSFIVNAMVHGNIFISFSAMSIAYLTSSLLNKNLSFQLALACFSIMFLVYTSNRFSDLKEDEINSPNRVYFVRKIGFLFLIISILLFFLSVFLIWPYSKVASILMFFPLIIGLLYNFSGLKKVILIKNLTVGLGWGVLPLVAGAFYQTYDNSIFIFSLFVGFVWIVNSTIFDLKDIPGDSEQGIITIPVKFGEKWTKIFCHFINFILFFMIFVFGYQHFLFFTLITMLIYVCIYIHFAKTRNNTYYYGIFVDGEFVFAAIFHYFLRAIT
ncbi:MAG: UbiA family prenyltransferase [Candidatus Sericytochromatia bacterium]|nr:UbiA family prenyltransferase [Candidatus Sericytochromatia bacterium]